jgi:hypothetical protein
MPQFSNVELLLGSEEAAALNISNRLSINISISTDLWHDIKYGINDLLPLAYTAY